MSQSPAAKVRTLYSVADMGGMGIPRKRPNPCEDSKEKAARTIQSFWWKVRFISTKRIVKTFIEKGPTVERLSKLG